ncbi:MAG: extracellular solute-binding protein [Acholeplasma sp.]|nr:extracellular solute-binding protein [Acholeplasma sp.]
MKKIFALIAAVMFSITLVACGGDRTGNKGGKLVEWYELSEDVEFDTTKKITIEFWHRMGADGQKIVQKWIGEFNEIYPNITVVETKAATDYNALADKIALEITTGNEPDIAESYPDHIARYAEADNAVLALNNFISHPTLGYSEDEIADFLSGLWAEGSSYDNEGSILSLPFTKSSEALYYNKTYFDAHEIDGKKYTEIIEEEGLTWDKIFKIAEDIKKRESDAIPFGYDSSDNLFITASAQWGAGYTEYNSKTGVGEVTFNNDTSKEMVKYFKDKVDKGLMITKDLNGDAYTSDIMKTGKKLYMYVGSTGGSKYAFDGMDQSVFDAGYTVGVTALPSKDGVTRKQIQQGPNINLLVKEDEQRMIAAWLFAKFMLEAERTAEFALQSGYAPLRHSAYETDTWKNYVAGIKEKPTSINEGKKKAAKDAIDMFRNNESVFFTSAVFNLSSRTRNEVGSLITTIFSSKATGEDLNKFINDEYTKSYEFITN